MRRFNVFLAAIAAFFVFVPSTTAQDIIKRGTIQWIPPSGQNGVEASIEYVIEYSTYMQEPTRKASARATVGNRVHYNGQVYTRSEVGGDLFDDFEFGPINIEADVMVGAARISTVRHTYLLSGDIAGSPSWSEIFPGVSAEGAKDAFRAPFTFGDVRLIDVSNRIYGMESWVKSREADAAYADAMERGRRLEQAGDLDGAKAAYDEAARAKPGESAARDASGRVADQIRQNQEFERERQRVAEQQRQAAEQQAAAQQAEQQRQADAEQVAQQAAAAREAERQRQQQEEFERIQRQGEETRRQIDETQDKVTTAISQGMANSKANTPFFTPGSGVYMTTAGWDDEESFGVDLGMVYEVLSAGFVANMSRINLTLGMMFYSAHETSPVVPEIDDAGTKLDVGELDFAGGQLGLGIKLLGKSDSILGNLIYPYVSVTAGELSYNIDPLGEGRQSEFTYSFEYGVRGTLAFIFYQAGYSEHYGTRVYGFGLVRPILGRRGG